MAGKSTSKHSQVPLAQALFHYEATLAKELKNQKKEKKNIIGQRTMATGKVLKCKKKRWAQG